MAAHAAELECDVQCTNPIWLEWLSLTVPCGHCVSCRMSHSREWSIRLMHEFQYTGGDASFVTLTYDDDHLPNDESVDKSEMQCFFKRLRKCMSSEGDKRKFKYFCSGEYGEEKGRPHYHVIFLGLGLSKKDRRYVEDAWHKGQIFFGEVTYDSCRYVADYVYKKYSGKKAKEVYGDKQVPFQLQSLGIGKRYLEDNAEDIRSRLSVSIRGVDVGIPRYYKRKLELTTDELAPKAIEKARETHDLHAERAGSDDPLDISNSLWAARRQADKNARAKLDMRKLRKNSIDK